MPSKNGASPNSKGNREWWVFVSAGNLFPVKTAQNFNFIVKQFRIDTEPLQIIDYFGKNFVRVPSVIGNTCYPEGGNLPQIGVSDLSDCHVEMSPNPRNYGPNNLSLPFETPVLGQMEFNLTNPYLQSSVPDPTVAPSFTGPHSLRNLGRAKL